MTDMGKVRHGAHDTEVEAAERVGPKVRERQQQALDLLTQYGPMNDDKLRRMLSLKFGPQSKSGPATRRGELVDMGLVRKARDAAGEVVKAPSDGGGNMTVWEVVPEGERTETDARPVSAGRRLDGLVCGLRSLLVRSDETVRSDDVLALVERYER